MLTKALYRAGLRDWHNHVASLASIYLCIGLWIRAKTVDQDERGNAERRALFVGPVAADVLAHRRLARAPRPAALAPLGAKPGSLLPSGG